MQLMSIFNGVPKNDNGVLEIIILTDQFSKNYLLFSFVQWTTSIPDSRPERMIIG